jgi:hypothetical protein
MSVEDASPIIDTSAQGERGSKEAPSAKEPCPFTKCSTRCRRPQELERHIYEHHLPYHIYRRYALGNHLAAKHAGVPMPEAEAYTIYDAKELVKQLLNKEIDVEQAVGEALSLFQKKAVQLGKLGIRRWMKRLEAICVSTSLGV